MTPQQLVGLGIRLASVWMAIVCFRFLVMIPSALQQADFSEKIVSAYLIGGAYALLALVLWVFPMWLAHRLLPRTRFENTVHLQAAEAARVGAALLGLWFFMTELVNATGYVFRALLLSGNRSFFEGLDRQAQADLLVTVVTLGLSLALMLRADKFAALVAGRGEPRPDEEKT